MVRKKGNLTKEQIVDYYEDGYSVNEIAEIDGTAYGNVIRFLHDADVAMRPRGTPKGSINHSKHGLNSGAKESGVSAVTLARFRVILHLGGECVGCGVDDLQVLELNHIEQRDHKLKQSDLVAAYRGTSMNLEVRCSNCNIRYEYENGRRVLPNPSSLEGWLNVQNN